ncbi:hypothetical protein DENSPDRAFT_57928 [Dentipellis sp. KUC8613]|nr:hypothetical protein DENSPDRAFT_57928 [Dentipellis sp. KUC8613]
MAMIWRGANRSPAKAALKRHQRRASLVYISGRPLVWWMRPEQMQRRGRNGVQLTLPIRDTCLFSEKAIEDTPGNCARRLSDTTTHGEYARDGPISEAYPCTLACLQRETKARRAVCSRVARNSASSRDRAHAGKGAAQGSGCVIEVRRRARR